jgi:hypothetical protein
MATPTKASRTIVASTSNAAGATTRGTLDLRTTFGGLLTVKMTNGATGPTAQCVCNILIAHNTGATPTAASRGTDWKTIASFGNGSANNAINEWSVTIPKDVHHVEAEFTGNTVQAVTVEAFLSETSSIA